MSPTRVISGRVSLLTPSPLSLLSSLILGRLTRWFNYGEGMCSSRAWWQRDYWLS